MTVTIKASVVTLRRLQGKTVQSNQERYESVTRHVSQILHDIKSINLMVINV
jgi:hypothetical protein